MDKKRRAKQTGVDSTPASFAPVPEDIIARLSTPGHHDYHTTMSEIFPAKKVNPSFQSFIDAARKQNAGPQAEAGLANKNESPVDGETISSGASILKDKEEIPKPDSPPVAPSIPGFGAPM